MDFSRRYNRIMWATVILLALASLGLLLVQLSNEYDHEIRVIQDHVQEQALTLDTILKGTTDQVDGLALRAESYLAVAAKPAPPSPLLQSLRDVPGNALYALDTIPAPYTATLVGNLTGSGSIAGRSPTYYRDVEMALALNPEFQIAKQNVHNAAWVYYTSRNGFINIYPWVPSQQFQFTPDLYQLDFYTRGRPDRDPTRERFWTKAYIDAAGKGLLVTCARPVYDGDTFLGTVAMDLTLDALNTFVKNFPYENGQIFVVNDDAQLLAHPTLVSSADKEVKTSPDAFGLDIRAKTVQILDGAEMAPQYPGPPGAHLILYKNLHNAPWKLVFIGQQSAIIASILPKVGLQVAVLLLSLILMVAISIRVTRREFILPAARLVQHIQQENAEAAPALPSVPTPWRPWFETVSRIFAQNRDLLHQLHLREERLKQEVQELRIEIDHVKQRRQVAEITENDDFLALAQRAKELRSRSRRAPVPTEAPAPNGQHTPTEGAGGQNGSEARESKPPLDLLTNSGLPE